MKPLNPIKFPFHFYLIRSLSVVTERSRSRVETLLNSCQFLNCNSCVVTERSRSAGRIHHIILKKEIPFLLSFLYYPNRKKSSVCKILRTQYANKMFNLKPTNYDVATKYKQRKVLQK